MTQSAPGSRPASRQGLLWGGLIAGPFFCTLVLLQAMIRPGFAFRTMPLSLLALGDLGWVQTSNFLITGVLIMACGLGLCRHPSGRGWLATPIVLYGVGMLAAGVFRSDPIDGFPVGSHQSPVMSQHAMLHGLAFGIAQVSLSVASLVSAAKSARVARSWAICSLVTALLTPAIVIFGFTHPSDMGLAFFGTGLIGLFWLGVLSWRLGLAADG